MNVRVPLLVTALTLMGAQAYIMNVYFIQALHYSYAWIIADILLAISWVIEYHFSKMVSNRRWEQAGMNSLKKKPTYAPFAFVSWGLYACVLATRMIILYKDGVPSVALFSSNAITMSLTLGAFLLIPLVLLHHSPRKETGSSLRNCFLAFVVFNLFVPSLGLLSISRVANDADSAVRILQLKLLYSVVLIVTNIPPMLLRLLAWRNFSCTISTWVVKNVMMVVLECLTIKHTIDDIDSARRSSQKPGYETGNTRDVMWHSDLFLSNNGAGFAPLWRPGDAGSVSIDDPVQPKECQFTDSQVDEICRKGFYEDPKSGELFTIMLDD